MMMISNESREMVCLIPTLMMVAVCITEVMAVGTPEDQMRLYNRLMANYSRFIRMQTEPTVVSLDPAIYSIVDVNEARESIIIAQWFEVAWNDLMLTWNPMDYGGIDKIRLQQDMVWMPDITIYELLEYTRQGEPGTAHQSFVSVSHDGTVFLSRTEQLTVHCLFDVGDFPNDKQQCNMTYVTWAYPDSEIILKPADPIPRMKFYKSSNVSEWELLNYECEKTLVHYGVAGYWYEVTYMVSIRRKPFYYIVTLMFPSYLITNLALIGVFSPSQADQDRSEKVSIGLTALLTMAVVLMMVSELMPKNATSFPKLGGSKSLGSFILFEMCIMVFSTIVAVIIMYVHSRAHFGAYIPRPLRRLLVGRRVSGESCSDDSDLLIDDQYAIFQNRQAVGEKLAHYTDSLTNNTNSSYFKVQCKIYLTVKEAVTVLRQLYAWMDAAELKRARKRHIQNDWTILCHRLDCIFLMLSLIANATVTYVFYNY